VRVKDPWVVGLVLAGLALLLGGCAFGPLLSGAQVLPATISPNADGVDDVAHITYQVGRPVDVSIYFAEGNGQRYYFRKDQRRSPGKYDVYWGGVINDPQVRQVTGGQELVESRVLPDGTYKWVVEATDDSGRQDQAEGQIVIQGADTALPDLQNFTVVPKDFTPNQDSFHDRVSISYYLTKQAERIRVYLEKPGSSQDAASLKYPITEQPSASMVDPGSAGYHGYQYDGGVDLNAEPPPDGDYIIKAEAEDRVGNHVVVSSTLTIREGGKPRAEVAGGEIDWQGELNRVVSAPLGQSLCFTATVVNIGPVPIRTAGPWPGQVYKFTENNNTLATKYNDPSYYQQIGSFRFGVNFDTTGVDYPFRWAIGRKEDLERRVIDGKEQYYLLPGHRGQVYGCIEFDQKPPVGTQFWWGGLIHEGVEIVNDQVNRIEVQVGAP
jgi:hypothetical protein